MTTEYSNLLKHPRWYQKRKVIIARDGKKCRCCGATHGLQVHHRQYHINKRTGSFQLPWNYQNRYLITLCGKCHESGHSVFRVPTFTIS